MTSETRPVAVVGAPSTTSSITMTLLREAYRLPVHGQMMSFEQTIIHPDTGETRTERALGTVTEVETVNAEYGPRSLTAMHIASGAGVPNRAGDAGDTRAVSLAIEAVFRRDDTEHAAPGQHTWDAAGASLSNSPATGTPVGFLDQRLVNQLMNGVENQRWIGTLRGTNTKVPWTARDFTGSRGAWHGCVVGATGSGKSGAATYVLASDLYFESMGHIIFDPQAQWATEHGMVFSLQGLAASLGRQVTVARLSRTLRLRKDAEMFTDLLTRVELFRELSFGAGSADQIAAAASIFKDALDDKKALEGATGTGDWTEADPEDLLAYLLEVLREVLPTGVIYAGKDGQDRVRYAIRKPTYDELEEAGQDGSLAAQFRDGILDDRASGGRRWRKAVSRFTPIHNMWSRFTPEGARKVADGADPDGLAEHEKRRKAWGLMSEVFAQDSSRPAPLLIIDLSADVDPALMAPADGEDVDEEAVAAADQARATLDHPGVKARIMRQLVGDLNRAGLAAFKGGQALNVKVWFDEAWMVASQPDASTDKDVAALSNSLADGARDLRKLGVGISLVTQTPTSIREDIWKQLAVRVIGYGITEASDTKRLANIVGDQHMRLYLSTAGPEATGRYPFMIAGGGATGLSFGTKPVFLDMLTDPANFLALNQEWIASQRRTYAHLLPAGDHGGELMAMPERPTQDAYLEGVRHAQGLRSGAANQAAAKRLAAGAKAPKKAFGITPETPAAAENDTYGPPPF